MTAQTRMVKANGLDMQIVEQGKGPLVLLCHGWPELSYSWRHQIPAIAAAGYRVVAPDMRGYGGTSAPKDIGAYSIFHLVGDVVALGNASVEVMEADGGRARRVRVTLPPLAEKSDDADESTARSDDPGADAGVGS